MSRPMPRISLVPQSREFFDLFTNASANAVDIARRLVGLLEKFPDNGDQLREIKELEHEGDRLTHEVVDLLNRTFVTPFDRDDIYRLAGAIDDVCDHIDEAAGNIAATGSSGFRPKARSRREVILRAARSSTRRSAPRGLQGLEQPATSRCATLEDEGDRLNRDAVAELFCVRDDADRDDPLEGHPRAARGGRRRLRERGRRARGDSRQEPIAPLGVDDVLLVTVIVVALAFDFTNGFHDTANAVATSVSTRALTPRIAVLIASVANLAGAFVTTAVAKTIGQGIIYTEPRHREDDARGAVGRDRLEPAHVVVRTAVELVARAHRRSDRRRARPVGHARRATGTASCTRSSSRAISRPSSPSSAAFAAPARDLLGLPARSRAGAPTAASASGSSSRARSSRSRTARTTRRRRWA